MAPARTRPHSSAPARTPSDLGYHVPRRVDEACGHLDQLAATRGHLVPRPLSRVRRGRHRRHRRHHPFRARAPERPERQLPPARRRDAQGAAAADAARALSRNPDQRVLDPRSRPRLRAALGARPRPGGDRRLGLQRLGRQVPALRRRRCGADARGAGAGTAGVRAGHRDGGRRRRLQRCRHRAHDHVVPVEHEPESAALESARSSATCATTTASSTSSGSATASRATTPTATSTTSRGSWTRETIVDRHRGRPARCQLLGAARCAPPARQARATRKGGRSRSSELPMPKPVAWKGQRLPATYMNFYFVNGACWCRSSPPSARRSP